MSWIRASPDVPYVPTVPVLLRRAVERYGVNDFVVLKDQRLSFRDAEVRSGQLARALLDAGAGKATRIGIILPTGVDWVIAWLAAARIGALAMLLPATYRPAELRRALVIGDVAILFAPRAMLGKDYESFLEEAVPGLAGHQHGPIRDPRVPFLRSIWTNGKSDRSWATGFTDAGNGPLTDQLMLSAVEDAVSPADPLLVIYTSGSSADPKAIVHTHGAAIRKIQPELEMCLPGSFPGRTFCAMPFFWVGGPQLLGALHSGAAVVTQPRFDSQEAVELLERERCTSIMGWASLLDQLKADPTFESRDLSSLEPAAPPARSSRQDLRNLGMTETFGPHANSEWFDYKVIDHDTGDELPGGEDGEFCVRGFGLMAGMYKREREDVFDPDGWYHTGDRGYIEAGTIWFTGRYSEMIKCGGANVSPLEVEGVLASHPGVAMAFVVGLPDPVRGQEVAAAVVPAEGVELDVEQLRLHTNQRLSAYKVPTRWLLVQTGEVPVLASGKPDKRALADRFHAGGQPA